MKITLKFCRGFDWYNVELVELNSFKEFFWFFVRNSEKGLIYDVKLVGDCNDIQNFQR